MKTKQFFQMFLLAIIFLLISHVQAAENMEEKTTEDIKDCAETALTGLLTVGISLYYITLPVRWFLESIVSTILGSWYPPLDTLIGNV